MRQRNLAFEFLKKLLNDEIKARSRKNLMQSDSFAEMLERSIRKYQNKSIETAKVIEELIRLAKDMCEALNGRGEKLNLRDSPDA
jgi:type I restriction enzyme, R subunit